MTENNKTISNDAVDAIAVEFTQRCMNSWSKMDLPQEPMARSFVAQGALMTAAIIGAPRCAAELREMADQIELGQMTVAGSS
jgi:hypothetical protein